MQLKSIRIENFRSIEDLTVNFSNFTALVGANNSGKSTILKAIEIFFDAAPKLSSNDYFMKSADKDIVITCIFDKFVPAEQEEFGSSIINEELSVSREFTGDGRDFGMYSVQIMGNTNFEHAYSGSATAKRAAYRVLREGEYPELPNAANAEAVDAALKEWETANPQRLTRIRKKGFFGAPNVANGKLRKRTSVNLIPAIKDVSAEVGKKSPVLSLLGSISEQTIKNQEKFKIFQEEASVRFQDLTNPESIPQLKAIGTGLTNCLQQYYSDASLAAEWDQVDTLQINFPSPRITIAHREISTAIEFVGHGLQRAVLFSIVQYLAQQEQSGQPVEGVYDVPQSDIIILIEEPEAFQHPGKQELIYDALAKIAETFNTITGIRFQIAYTTHSEKLVNVRNFDGVRLIRKSVDEARRLRTKCSAYSIDTCRGRLAEFKNENPMSREAFSATLHIFTREINEGFFADKVILVEGVSDKAIIEAAYKYKGINPKREGIFLVSVHGKTKLDKPALIFKGLQIPTFIITDNDIKEKNVREKAEGSKYNRLLQYICQIEPATDFPEGISNNIIFFAGNLEEYLKLVTGEDYVKLREKAAVKFGINVGDMKKTPAVIASFFSYAQEGGYNFPLIEEILAAVGKMT